MDSDEKNSAKSRFAEAVIKDIFLSSEQLKPTEEQLWAYALDMLEPWEQDQVMEMIARSEELQQTVARIRESIAAVAEPSLVIAALAKAKSALAAMGETLFSVAAVIVREKDGLITAFIHPECDYEEPELVMVGKGEPKQDDLKAKPQVKLKKGNEGLNLSIVHVPDRGVDIYLEVTKPPMEGWVRLVQVFAEDGVAKEKDTGIKVHLKDGKARLVDCPDGKLKVVAPGDRSISFYI